MEPRDAPTCGIDQCQSGDPALSPTGTTVQATTEPVVRLEIVSDIICPWCYVGKRRLEKALHLVGRQVPVTVTWLPFELNPTMPAGGLDRRGYRAQKFGSWERSRQLDAEVAAVGAQEGLAFHHERIARTPNTLDAHRLVWFAGREHFQGPLVEELFRAYFVEGWDVGDRSVLADAAVAVGAARAPVEAFLSGEGGFAEVRQEEDALHRLGINGVPTVLANGRVLFSGAQRTELIAAAIRQATTGRSGS